MGEERMTWQEVCRELLRLNNEGHKEPWTEFRWTGGGYLGWRSCENLDDLLAATALEDCRVRFAPRTVRVTTHSGETLELPEPWWDVPEGAIYYFVSGTGSAEETRNINPGLDRAIIGTGNAFRTESDAQAWADAMPKIRGRD